MSTEEMIMENNAMLRVLLKNQAASMQILSEAISKLNKDPVTTDEMFQKREVLVDLLFQKMLLEVDMLKTEMQYGATSY